MHAIVLIECYHRFTDACRHHPGIPFFHDAYKGWSCCNKKSVDFTEFLNIKGCQVSKHSNVKPPEPEKPAPVEIVDEPVMVKIREPVKPSALKRPSLDTELTALEAVVAPALKQSIDNLAPSERKVVYNNPKYDSKYCHLEISTHDAIQFFFICSDIQVGTLCKNGGCGIAYESTATKDTECVHHPGVPIFHEGLKFWSCCQKKTTDFTAFMNQKGCAFGKHKWIQDVRMNWHIN